MAYAMKRRRNAGAPKRRTQLTKMRGSASFKRGQRLAGKLIAGRKLRGSQKEIRQQIHALVRDQGSKSDIALLEGPTGVGKAPHQFRKGLASVAADVAGFKPSRSSSRAGKTVSREFARDKRDTKRGFESASAQAMRVRAEQGVSLKEAWAIVKGESKPKRKSSSKRKSSASSAKRKRIKMPGGGFRYMVDGKFASKAKYDAAGRSNPRRNGTKKGQRRKTSRRAYEKNPFGAEFLFI